jgi:HAD superfamily hydrolase (TIGR01484 family)
MKDERFKNIRLIATDMDGTLTLEGKYTSQLLKTLEDLQSSGAIVLIVTGRSAGWVNAVTHYLPVVGAIAENGGLLYLNGREAAEFLTPISDITSHRQKLAATFQLLQNKFPAIAESADNRFRITDWTFDVAGLNQQALQQMQEICHQQGWSFTYSTVQCHIKPLEQDKAIALLQVLRKHFPQFTLEQILTVGDSPNDESLFDRHKFPFSAGVANVLHYKMQLKHLPSYVTNKAEGEGFSELAQLIIN